VAVGDVDGDGLKDLVIQTGDPNHKKSIYLFGS
jgi:hypothetical protein